MPDALLASLLLFAALVCSVLGMAFIALAMPAHWAQLHGDAVALPRATQSLLRAVAAGLIGASLMSCLAADYPSMAALVWVMAVTAGALIVAFTLSWRARLLAPLLAWVPGRAGVDQAHGAAQPEQRR